MLALPLKIEDWTIFDSNGDIIACGCGLLDSERVKYAEEIVAAVNSSRALLAAAKDARDHLRHFRARTALDNDCMNALEAAITAAEAVP
jgi:hypothetical protein